MSTSEKYTELRVCLPVPPYAIMAHLLLADSLGYAEEEGLRLVFNIVDGPETAIEGVGDGHFDVAVGNAVFAFRMREREVPVRAFYSTCRGVYRSFAVLTDSPISTVPELRGRRIGTDFPDLLDLAFPTLRDEGLDPENDVTFLPRSIPIPGVAPTPAELERIANGELDAIWVLRCGYEMLVADGLPLRRLPTRTLDGLTPSELLYANDDMLLGSPDALAGFGRAVAKASVFCDANPEAAVRLVWKHFPEAGPAPGDEEKALRRDVAGLRGRTERGRPEHGREPAWGSITLEEVQDWEDFLLANGGLQGRRELGEYVEPGLVGAFNDFDPGAVEAQARQWPPAHRR
jgi:NitT/TauT family transport system substrate-binding protein